MPEDREPRGDIQNNDKKDEGRDTKRSADGRSVLLGNTNAIACAKVLEEGIQDIGTTIRLCFAGVEDMLSGAITIGEATVINTAVGRALKGVELQLKYSRRGEKCTAIRLPESNGNPDH